jgi:hypothetical protein
MEEFVDQDDLKSLKRSEFNKSRIERELVMPQAQATTRVPSMKEKLRQYTSNKANKGQKMLNKKHSEALLIASGIKSPQKVYTEQDQKQDQNNYFNFAGESHNSILEESMVMNIEEMESMQGI